MKHFLFFDTETTGLPKNYKAPVSDTDNWPRVIQLAWQLYDEDGTLIDEFSELIKPDGWEIPNKAYWLRQGLSDEVATKKGDFWDKYGYTQEKNEAEGVPILYALEKFGEAIRKADYLLAHNMSYDQPVMGAEFFRVNKITGKVITKICTKVTSTSYCKIPNKGRGGYKWPTLTELHMKLFGVGFEGAHDALDDVKALKTCAFRLIELGVIKL